MTDPSPTADEMMINTIDSTTEFDVDQSSTKKQLVFLAGPQLSGMQAVHEFFVHHMSDYRSHQHAESLQGWSWPYVDPSLLPVEFQSLPHTRLLDLLVQEHSHNQDVVHTLLHSIQQTWKTSDYGLVIGTEYLDRNTDEHSFNVMRQVVNKLGVTADQVHVVLAYETPRVDHWNRFFQSNSNELLVTYDQWMCPPTDTISTTLLDESASRYKTLETSMNPLKLAQGIRDRYEWNVDVIDVVGLDANDQDLAHTIACRIFRHVDCHEGWLKGLNDATSTTFGQDLVDETLPTIGTSLTPGQQDELETYFTDRDCHFRYKLMQDDPGVRVIYKTELWMDCHSNRTGTIRQGYRQLADTRYLLQQLQEQVGCGDTGYYNPKTNAMYDTLQAADVATAALNKKYGFVEPTSIVPLILLVVSVMVFAMVGWHGIIMVIKQRRRTRHANQVMAQLDHAEHHGADDFEVASSPPQPHAMTTVRRDPWEAVNAARDASFSRRNSSRSKAYVRHSPRRHDTTAASPSSPQHNLSPNSLQYSNERNGSHYEVDVNDDDEPVVRIMDRSYDDDLDNSFYRHHHDQGEDEEDPYHHDLQEIDLAVHRHRLS